MASARASAIFFSLVLVAAAAGFAWWRAHGLRWDGAVPFDPAFHRLTPEEVVTLPLAVRFDMPLGSQHGALTYNARPFRISRHLGDDLNGIGGENSDLGDPVFAAGMGRVVYTGRPGSGWGKCCRCSYPSCVSILAPCYSIPTLSADGRYKHHQNYNTGWL